MTEKGQILHTNGHRDPVAIIGSKVVVTLLIGFIVVTLTTVGGVMVLHWRVGQIEDRLDGLTQKIDSGMDSRWRRTDQDAYAREVDRRLRDLEQRPFPFTEAKSEQLTRIAVDVDRLRADVEECKRRWAAHDAAHHDEVKK